MGIESPDGHDDRKVWQLALVREFLAQPLVADDLRHTADLQRLALPWHEYANRVWCDPALPDAYSVWCALGALAPRGPQVNAKDEELFGMSVPVSDGAPCDR